MQCAVVLRVGVTIKQIKTEHLQHLLILSSLSQMYIYMNTKENFLSTAKFEWALPWYAYHGCGRMYQFSSGKTMRLFTLVLIMPT